MISLKPREIIPKTLSRGTKALYLEYSGSPFLFLFVTPTRYTLEWKGIIDFTQLEVEAVQSLNLSFDAKLSLEQTDLRSATAVSFVIPLSDDSDELAEFHLSDQDDYRQYLVALSKPDQIVFARYDFYKSSSEPEYSFIADNPRSVDPAKVKLAVKLPTSQPCSEPLLDWIVQHHVRRASLANSLDRTDALRAIRTTVLSTAKALAVK